MRSFPNLSQHEIYALKVTPGMDEAQEYLLYAPLAGISILTGAGQVERLEDGLSGAHPSDPETVSLLAELLDSNHARPVNYVKKPADVRSLTILPTSNCNFSCSYCYAAAGHNGKELDFRHLKVVLDYFIDPGRIAPCDLYISFGGGGEPFLSWEIVRQGLEYAGDLGKKYGFSLHFSFASNGSVITDEILATLPDYHVKANISFDILPEIQNLQRRHYDLVARNLDRLVAAGIVPSINAVITPDNVDLQEKMAEHMAYRFPGIRRMSFDPVIGGDLFLDEKALKVFYRRYTEQFFIARRRGRELGIDVNSIKLRETNLLRDRACPGGFDLTPEGTVSVCFLVSSSKEPFYDEFVYGHVSPEDQLVLDEDKFSRLVHSDVNDSEACRSCFARWHCGGGCYYQNLRYGPGLKAIYCEFTRNFTLRALLEKHDGQS